MKVYGTKSIRQQVTPTLSAFLLVALSLLLLAFTLDGKDHGDTYEGEVPQGATFTVNAQGNDPDADLTDDLCATARGGCTLRAAIQQANATIGADDIAFNLGPGIPTLDTGSLPEVRETVTIDGATGGATQVELTGITVGFPAGTNGTGLVFTGDNNEVRNLIIIGYASPGITLRNGTGSLIENTWVGLSKTGIAIPNVEGGLLIDNSANNTIGGQTEDKRNIFSGNNENGITIRGAGAKMNKVEGNYIGTNANGDGTPNKHNSPMCANEEAGILIDNAPENTIGGAEPGMRNVISGNGTSGVLIRGQQATKNVVAGNYIGTDKDGTASLGNGDAGVTLDGAPENIIGIDLVIGAGNLISGNPIGVVVNGTEAKKNVVAGNNIGTDKDGTARLPNGTGIHVDDAPENRIGGSLNAETNIISGNEDEGIHLSGSEAKKNVVEGNYIGIDASGADSLGNGRDGVFIEDAPENTIGRIGTGNVISGNKEQGLHILGEGATMNVVEGNYIGTNIDGTMALPNEENGVLLFDAPNNMIGKAVIGMNNVISGNKKSGVVIDRFTEAQGNTVAGNYIGTTGDGEASLSNGAHGVVIDAATANTIDANTISGNDSSGVHIIVGTGNIISGNTIGTDKDGVTPLSNGQHGVALIDPDPNAPTSTGSSNNTVTNNLIAYNGSDGIFVSGSTSVSNAIRTNNIVSNDGLGINLKNDGVTENDDGDSDTGPNVLQNFPVLTSASGENDLTIGGALNSKANATFRIEFFVNEACDPSGHGEGEFILGSTNVTTDSNGNANILATFEDAMVPMGLFITATATDSTKSTSEFSACVDVGEGAGCSLVVTTTNDVGAGSLREAITCANLTPNGTAPDVISFAIPGAGVPVIAPTSALPTVTDPVVIDATTQPEAGMVQVDGNDAGDEANGLHLTAGGSTIKGLALTRFGQHGILLEAEGENTITQTTIGTDAEGTPGLGNLADGISIGEGSHMNMIGGAEETAGNIIYGNAGAGVAVTGDAMGNTIRSNSISENGGLGIDLADDGVTDNDDDDIDAGPNTLQNFPVLTTALSGSLRLEGTLNSTPDTDFTLDFFANTVCGASDHGQGDVFLGIETVTTDANGDAVFMVTFAEVDLTEGFVAATATDPNGNTSEFSTCVAITSTTVAVEGEPEVPLVFRLHPNYPNPFNPETTIAFEVPHAGYVSLKVYNTLGQQVADLVAETRAAGRYTTTWNAANLPSGVYYFQIKASDFQAIRPMVLVK